ncbi:MULTISPECIES: hypothetical protein [Flavobacterium]|uniref:hypothetical protein n=1 Tax=Flavobacterium TaxID=237 RepID=UPI001FCCAB97|nr:MULTISPECIES: hypothetical protein [Flavobacterium]UOK42134.1 hypothetical protein LZF87_12545 [Flavobacterium enshiense]
MLIYILVFLFFFVICSGLTFISYWIPKKLGLRKAGIILSSIVGLFFILFAVSDIFADELFSKNNARKLLSEQEISLKEDFEILENESMSGIGDYYHTFTLKISNSDKNRMISEIKKTTNFTTFTSNAIITDITKSTDYYEGEKVTQNYETENEFIKELFEPQGENYAPIWRKIRINKKENILIFEDIDE